MGKGRSTRLTAQDLAKANGGVTGLAKQLIQKMTNGDNATKETSVNILKNLTMQNHGEYRDVVYNAGAVKPLVALLVSGSAQSQESASAALNLLGQNKPEYQQAIVEAGGVPPLVQLLKTGSPKVQEESAAALAAIDSDVAFQAGIIKQGGIVPLVSMLKSGSGAAQASAAQAIANAAAFSSEAQKTIAKAGSIPLLLALLGTGKAQKPAASALANLAHENTEIQTEITDLGGIAPLLALLNGLDTDAQVAAAAALSEMACDNVDTQSAIAKAGGIGPLLALLSSRSAAAQSQGMAALAQLARNNHDNQDAISRMGGIKPLVLLLESHNNEVAAHSASALMEISRSNIENQRAVVDHGGIIQLANLMKTSSHADVRAEVAGALWSLSEDPEIKVAIASASTISPLVQLLGTGDERARIHAANALDSLGFDNKDNQVILTQMLIELLMSGTEDAQERAVKALRSMVDANPSAHESIAKAGNPGMLVELLKTGIADAKSYALWSLSLSISKENQSTVAEAGGVQPLIDQLLDDHVYVKEQAASALAKLAHDNKETRSAITKVGGVQPLIDLLTLAGPEAELVRQNGANALANLALDPAARDEIIGAGGVPPLVQVLGDEHNDTKKYAARAFGRLSKDHVETQEVIANAGAIEPLVKLLEGDCGEEAQEEAAGALFSLADHEKNRLAITEADGISWLVMLLCHVNKRAREHAEGALVRLSIENANRVLIIRKLVGMLQDSGAAAQEQSAAALANLARESEDNRKSIVEANGIVPLLAVLESTSAKAKENAVGAIKELCRNSKANQSLIAKAGGIPKLVGVMVGFSGNTMKDASLVKLCTLAASAIKEMAKGNRKNQDAITEAGAIVPLVAMLGSLDPQMQANSAGALANLARNHSENQGSIARTGAVAPLCLLVREGSEETKDKSASAIWSLATDHGPNKDTIAKLGGIDPLLGLLVTGLTTRSQEYVAGALAALASKHLDNRQVIAKRLVGLLGSSAVRASDRAERVLMTCSSFVSDSSANQVAFAKAGGIPPLIVWLNNMSQATQARAAHTVLCLAADNATTQVMIAKTEGIAPLITLVKNGMRQGGEEAQEYAARALWHLASQLESRPMIVEEGGIKPLIAMLASENDSASELSAVIIVRLARSTPEVSTEIANSGGILPLVKLVSSGSPGSQQQAAACLSELALVSKNRDKIANAGGIEPIIKLLTSASTGLPETAARALAHLSHTDDDESQEEERADYSEIRGSAERRSRIHSFFGIQKLILMLDGSNLKGTDKKGWTPTSMNDDKGKGIGFKDEAGLKVGMQEQAAIALADIAFDNADMQEAIIDAKGVPPLLVFMRTGSQLGQEHAARAIWHLAQLIDTHSAIVQAGGISEQVQLLKTGSPKAQEMAAAGLSELALGAVQERARLDAERHAAGLRIPSDILNTLNNESHEEDKDADEETYDNSDQLVAIAEAGGIMPLVTLLTSGTTQARENAAGALWHLALDKSNQIAIARVNGISPLVTILDDGTEKAHKHASDALARLATKSPDNQAQIAKHCVALLGNQSTGTQRRAAKALRDLARDNPGSPVVIVNAGAISPLVNLLSAGAAEVKEEAAGALSTLAFNSPSTQLAIASGLVVLVGTGSAEAQEHVTQLLNHLSVDPDNCAAIAKAGAIPRLVVQLRGGGRTSVKAQELAAAVLSNLSSSEDVVKAIASSNGIRPLVQMLSTGTPAAQAHAAAVLCDMARGLSRSQNIILSEGGITPLVKLLLKENAAKTKAEAAGALLALSAGHPETQAAVADAGAIQPLVALLDEEDEGARKKAAGAIAALCNGSTENQDAVEKNKGIIKLVTLLAATEPDEVRAEAAAALAVLAISNKTNQDKVAATGGIEPLVSLLQMPESSEHTKEEAAAALWSLSAQHYENQVAVADAGGIAPLVAVLGLGSVRAQEQAAGALAALALDNTKNEISIAKLIVSLLGSDDKQASAKAARAISRLARAHPSNQKSIAHAGGVSLLVSLLSVSEGGAGDSTYGNSASKEALEAARVQKEMASAIWSMAANNLENQMAIAKAGGILPLIALLEGNPEVHRDVAGALWALGANEENQKAIADNQGIVPLVGLLKTGSPGAQETAAGALHALASMDTNRDSIAAAGAISLLVALFDGGSDEARQQAAGALQTLVQQNVRNQFAVANETVAKLKSDASAAAQEYLTTLLRNLAQDPENRAAIAKAGAVPELVKQLEMGSEKAMGMAASGLALLALKSAEHRATVTQELVKLLGSSKAAVRQRASEALSDMSADDNPSSKKSVSAGSGVPLVNLLKDGLKDGRVEAQEYALRSLLAISDTASKEAIVEAGCINPLITALELGKLSAIAQEHAAAVLSGLAPIGDNAIAIKDAKGIDPLVKLLSEGNSDAKEHAADTLAQLALRAEAANDIAKAGAVSAFVKWLANPSLGPPEVAARALSEIALDNQDTQVQISEEGAISPLVAMVGVSTATPPGETASALAAALKVSNVAAGTLATLAKDNIVNQIMITEEHGIPPLVELLKSKTGSHKVDSYENATKALWHLAETEDNQAAIAKAGGIAPLVSLLTSESGETQQYAAAALQSLARDHTENQISLAKAGAITPLVDLLGSDTTETQEHAVGCLLSLASHDVESRNSVVKRLVGVLDMRNAAAQMKAAEALAVLAARSDENRKAITAAAAIEPLVRLLGDGRRVRAATPQERAAAVLSDLARAGDNKKKIVEAGGVNPLVAMLSSDSREAQTHAAGALLQLAALGSNKTIIAAAGAIPLLVNLLRCDTVDTQKFSTGALWHLASSADNKTEMVNAGAIPLLVAVLESPSSEAREHAAAVVSALARSQGGNKKVIYQKGGIAPLVKLLTDARPITQRHAACALWGLSDGKDGIYDRQIAEAGAIPLLIAMLLNDDQETRGFAAACMLCLCKDKSAHPAILEAGGAEPLQALSYGPATWLRGQVVEMLTLLGVPVPDPDTFAYINTPAGFGQGNGSPGDESPPTGIPSARGGMPSTRGGLSSARGGSARGSPRRGMPQISARMPPPTPGGTSARPALWQARMYAQY